MRKTTQKIFEVVGILATFLFVIYLIFSLINIFYSKNKINYTPKTNSVVAPLNTSVNNSTPPNEDEDVFEQRQLRADYNEGSSSPGY